MPHRDPEEAREYRRQYRQRPEVKARRRKEDRSRYRSKASDDAGRAAVRDKAAAWREENRDAWLRTQRACALKRRYGITIDDYDAMLDAQGGACALCGNPETLVRNGNVCALAVDHDHETGAVRGLLCSACNQGIGKFNHDTERLQMAIAYLHRHS